MPEDPILLVVGLSSLGALVSGIGALPYASERAVPVWAAGVASAVASGLMLGTGYLLALQGLERGLVGMAFGAVGAVGLVAAIQSYAGLDRLSFVPGQKQGLEFGYKILLQSSLHSAVEGVAIGTAIHLNLQLGVGVTLALAFHNIGEVMALTEFLKQRGTGLRESVGLGIMTNLPQVLLAVATFALAPALGSFLSTAIGLGATGMVYLVVTELLPASYERAPRSTIAFSVSISAGAVILARSLFL